MSAEYQDFCNTNYGPEDVPQPDILEHLILARCCGAKECQREPDDQDGMCANAAVMRAAETEIRRLRAALTSHKREGEA